MDDRQIRRLEGIINSMTPQERAKPELIKASRKRRIAAGAGASVQEVNRLLTQFEQQQLETPRLNAGFLGHVQRECEQRVAVAAQNQRYRADVAASAR